MKKIHGFLLVGLLFVLSMTSCQKEVMQPNPTPQTELSGTWVVQEKAMIADIQGTDTTWTESFYQGDGYCCSVDVVNVDYDSFEVGQQIVVNGDTYRVIDLNETGYGMAGDGQEQIYRYWIALVIEDPYIGCVNDMVLGKRLNE